MSELVGVVRRAASGVWWYLREVSGETAYDRYVEHCRRHEAVRVLSRREFERRRQDDRDRSPQQRCC
ncbi:YbdD/YjiX family protein [Jiangella rhizosphaerae]|uniref:DUF466 domain-containing protein n=1 Tax=Jiangella rhizosphaerae TaxID=2293569 RepID=A0A418KS67_9ACTN|nr:YbdD/YjiX family protein [Jiangella rhizosphaerae]RIQ26882.1 DUF466 domain-containing protein [Jiangella rhizosphaerae]